MCCAVLWCASTQGVARYEYGESEISGALGCVPERGLGMRNRLAESTSVIGLNHAGLIVMRTHVFNTINV